jgi:hypothetical protein
MAIQEFLKMFGEAGLVFTILMTVVYFLARAYWKKDKELKLKTEKFENHLITTQHTQVESAVKISNFMDAINQRLSVIEHKI